MAQAVSRRPLAGRVWLQCQVILYEICGGQKGTMEGILRVLWSYLVIIIPPVLLTHSVVYYLCYVISAFDNVIIIDKGNITPLPQLQTLVFFNLLKPTGHVMLHQFNIQQLLRSANTVFMCFVFICEQTATCGTYIINGLVFITEMKSVYCAVRTGSLNKAVCASYLKG